MKYKDIFTLLFILLVTLSTYAQELIVFTITTRPVGLESKEANGFVSLSDIDHLSEHPDSLAIPNISYNDSNKYDKLNYIELSSQYRTRFFSRTNIDEKDKIFIYSYSEDILVTIPVCNLKVVAWLNAYTSPEECPCPEYYYQIGFEIEKKFLAGFENHYTNTLVFVGYKNPFVRNQVKPVVWQEIDSSEFPANLITKEVNFNFGNNDFEYDLGQAYKFENEKYQFFIQKLIKNNQQFGLRLLVSDSINQDKIFEELYFSGESSSFAGLNNQWIGRLFKNEPMVIFGFRWHSFGCPPITFIDPNKESIFIKCDNRH